MIQIFRLQSKHKKHYAVLLVVIVGWVLELATLYSMPSSPYSLSEYKFFWLSATQSRLALFIFSVLMLYSVRGSILVTLIMGFNLLAIGMNIMYLDPYNHGFISQFRADFFGPAYRTAELMITTWALWHVRTEIYNSSLIFLRRRRFMGYLWGLFNKGIQG